MIAQLGARPLRKLAALRGIPQNVRLLDIHGQNADARGYRQLLGAWLRDAATRDLLLTHVAVDGGAFGTMAANRAAEYAVFSSPELPDMLSEAQATVIPMSRLRGTR